MTRFCRGKSICLCGRRASALLPSHFSPQASPRASILAGRCRRHYQRHGLSPHCPYSQTSSTFLENTLTVDGITFWWGLFKQVASDRWEDMDAFTYYSLEVWKLLSFPVTNRPGNFAASRDTGYLRNEDIVDAWVRDYVEHLSTKCRCCGVRTSHAEGERIISMVRHQREEEIHI
jgi:hypothetical protein